MKTKLAIAMLVIAGSAWGQTNITINTTNNPIIEMFVAACSTNGFDTTDFIRKLAKSGRICEVLGHCWEADLLGMLQLVHYPNGRPSVRKCKLCGKYETKQPEVWK